MMNNSEKLYCQWLLAVFSEMSKSTSEYFGISYERCHVSVRYEGAGVDYLKSHPRYFDPVNGTPCYRRIRKEKFPSWKTLKSVVEFMGYEVVDREKTGNFDIRSASSRTMVGTVVIWG